MSALRTFIILVVLLVLYGAVGTIDREDNRTISSFSNWPEVSKAFGPEDNGLKERVKKKSSGVSVP